MTTSTTSETVVGVLGGAASGYLLWLVAISIGDNATVGRWGPPVLLLSAVLGICAGVCGWWLRRHRRYLWMGFVWGLPILPVTLMLAVLVNIYV